MKKLLIIALLIIMASASFAKYTYDSETAPNTQLLQKQYRFYIQSDKYPEFIIPYLGPKLECFLLMNDDNILISGGLYDIFSGMAEEYEKDPASALARFRKDYALSPSEAQIAANWAKMIKRVINLEETRIVPSGSTQEKELVVSYVVAKLELEKQFNSYQSPKVRQKAFYATKLMTESLNLEMDMAKYRDQSPAEK